ncbi:DUF3958 family protein [Enterococcus sp. LJL51]
MMTEKIAKAQKKVRLQLEENEDRQRQLSKQMERIEALCKAELRQDQRLTEMFPTSETGSHIQDLSYENQQLGRELLGDLEEAREQLVKEQLDLESEESELYYQARLEAEKEEKHG